MCLDKVPVDICKSIADFLPEENTKALIQSLLYTRRYKLELPHLLKYFATRKSANGLIYAVRCNKKHLLKRILKIECIDFNIRDEGGRTALLIAAERADLEAVTALLSKPGIDVNVLDQVRHTPLGWAIRTQHLGIVEALLRTGKIDISIKDFENSTLLIHGISRGGSDVAKRLVSAAKTSDFTLKNKHGFTALHYLLDEGCDETIKMFLSKDPIPSTIDLLEKHLLLRTIGRRRESIALHILRIEGFRALATESGAELLFSASIGGLKSVVEELLLHHAINRNAINGRNMNALQLASMSKRLEIMQLLFSFGISPRGDQSILRVAAQHGDYKFFQQLLSHKSYGSIRLDTESLLHNAVQGQDQTLIDSVLNMMRDINYEQLLTAAVACDVPGTVQLSIERLFDHGEQISLGEVLILAVQNRSRSVLTLLFDKYSMDPNYTDYLGRTALWHAVSVSCIPIISFFLGLGEVDPNKPDKAGQTPLYLASSECNPSRDVLQLLALDSRIKPDYQKQGIAVTKALRKGGGNHELLRRLRRRGFLDEGYRTRKSAVQRMKL